MKFQKNKSERCGTMVVYYHEICRFFLTRKTFSRFSYQTSKQKNKNKYKSDEN